MSETIPEPDPKPGPFFSQRRCFLDKDRWCGAECIAFRTRDGSCKILETLDAVRTMCTRGEAPKV